MKPSLIPIGPARQLSHLAPILCSLALILAGCASGPSYNELKSAFPAIPPGLGRIFMYRTYNYMGGGTPGVMALNGELVGQCPAGGFFYIDRPPGTYHLEALGQSMGWIGSVGQQTFALRAGEVVYVKVMLEVVHTVDLVSPEQAAGELPRVALEPPYVQGDSRIRPALAQRAKSNFEAYKQASGLDFQTASAAPGSIASQPPARQPQSVLGAVQTTQTPTASEASPLAATMAHPDDTVTRVATQEPAPAAEVRSSSSPVASGPVAPTPEDAEFLLGRHLLPSPTGLYSAESEYNFNVLDDVTFDAASGALSLVGHRDPSYSGPRIPYLQYLATLLESPKPEFTLTLTQDSSARVDDLFNRTMSPSEGGRISEEWGRVADAQGNVTEVGKYMLPAAGIYPTPNNVPLGYIGMETTYAGHGWCKVSSVEPGSPAAEAGIKPGFTIIQFDHSTANTPFLIQHKVRMFGAGSAIDIQYVGNNGFNTVTVYLGASPDNDRWKDVTNYDMVAAVYRSAGKQQASRVASVFGLLKYVQDNYPNDNELAQAALRTLLSEMGIQDQFDQFGQKVQAGALAPQVAMVQTGELIAGKFEELFNLPPGSLNNVFQANLRNTGNFGASFAAIFPEFDVQHKPKFAELLDRFIFRPEGLQIAPELVEKQFHVHPEMYPEYLGVPADSQLGRLMFQADYAAKRLINDPSLASKVDGYETSFGFERSHPQFMRNEASYHLWISVDRMDTPQSPGGRTLKFRDVRMRFNVRELGADGRDLPNQPGGYEELLTRLYEPLSRQYPALHDLKEAAKLAAAARWIQSRSPGFRLPAEGRVAWKGPSRVPGFVYLYLYPDSSMHTHVHFIAAGGVSLVPFPPGNASNPFKDDSSVVDLTQSSDVVSLLRSPGDPEGSPVGYLRVKISPAELQATPLAAQKAQETKYKISQARELLQQLSDVDAAISALNLGDPDSMARLQELQARRRALRAEFNTYAAATLAQAINDVRNQLQCDGSLYDGSHPEVDRSKLASFVYGGYAGDLDKYLSGSASPSGLDPKTLEAALKQANDPAVSAYLARLGDLGAVQFIARCEKGYAALDDVVAYKVPAAGTQSSTEVSALSGKLTAFEGQLSAEAVSTLGDIEALPGGYRSEGSDHKAGDQLVAAAKIADLINNGANADLRANFDAGTAVYAGSLPVPQDVVKYGAAMADEVATFSDRARSNPDMKTALGQLEEVRKKRVDMEGELRALEDKRNKADAASMPALNAQVDQKQAEYQKALKDVSDASEKVKKLHRSIDTSVDTTPDASTGSK